MKCLFSLVNKPEALHFISDKMTGASHKLLPKLSELLAQPPTKTVQSSVITSLLSLLLGFLSFTLGGDSNRNVGAHIGVMLNTMVLEKINTATHRGVSRQLCR